jgi:hypothetical protein
MLVAAEVPFSHRYSNVTEGFVIRYKPAFGIAVKI